METATVDPKAVVERLQRVLVQHIQEKDVAALTEDFYADQAQFHAPNAPPSIGRPAVTEAIQRLFDKGLCHMELKTIDVRSAGDTIWNRGEYVIVLERPQGTINDKGTYVSIFEPQDDGAYRCVLDIFNSDLPPTISATG